MEMELLDTTAPSETELRITSLDRAINYHINREGDPEKIVATAATFLAYIQGQK